MYDDFEFELRKTDSNFNWKIADLKIFEIYFYLIYLKYLNKINENIYFDFWGKLLNVDDFQNLLKSCLEEFLEDNYKDYELENEELDLVYSMYKLIFDINFPKSNLKSKSVIISYIEKFLETQTKISKSLFQSNSKLEFLKVLDNRFKKIFISENVNIVDFLKRFRNNEIEKLYLKKINLFQKVYLSLFNQNYKCYKSINFFRTDLNIYDFSISNKDYDRKSNNLNEIKNLVYTITKKKENKRLNNTYLIFDIRYVNYIEIKRFLFQLANDNYLKSVIFNDKRNEVIFELFFEDKENDIIKIFYFDRIKDLSNVEFFFNVSSKYSLIRKDDFLEEVITLRALFEEKNVKKLSDFFRVFNGDGVLDFKISRKKKSKEFIFDENDYGLYIVKKNDLKEKNYSNIIDNTKLKKIKYSKIFTKLNKKAILLFWDSNELHVKIFNPDQIVSSVVIEKGIFALVPNDKKINLEEVLYFFESPEFKNKLSLNTKKIKLLYEIFEFILNLNISVIFDEEIGKNVQNNAQENIEKNMLNEFRHKTSSKLSRAIQNIEEIENFLEGEDLLNKKLFDFDPSSNKEDDLAEPVRDVIQNTLSDLKTIQDYELKIKEYFTSLKREEFQLIDIYEILVNVKNDFKKYLKNKNIKIEINGNKNECRIFVHKKAFRDIIEELINNAYKYGFDNEHKQLKISFTLKKDFFKKQIILEYSNDGKLTSITKDDFILLGSTSNNNSTGYGGAMIDKYIKEFNGDLELFTTNKFTIHFYFPIYEVQ